ncbi:MAG: hypothetical protein QXI60_03370 [Thermofilaceae archaeon]
MATHLIAYTASIDSATPVALNTVVDDVLTRTGTTRYVVPDEYNNVRFAIASGPNLTRAQLRSPSLDARLWFPEVIPHRRGAETLSLTVPEVYVPAAPIALVPSEELEAFAAEDATGASQVNVFVALGPAELPAPPGGDLRVLRFTGSTTLTARTWTTVTLTPDRSIEPGEYTVVHFLAISANAIAARLILPPQIWRPGLPALAGTEAVARDAYLAPLEAVSFYNMGTFTHVRLPVIQFFSAAADTSEVVYIWAVRAA